MESAPKEAALPRALIRLFPALCGLLSIACSSASAQIIEDAGIRTWTHIFNNWSMEDNQFFNIAAQLPSGVQVDKILGVKVMVYSDETTPEVFNLSRLGNKRSNQAAGHNSMRAGGWADLQVASDRWITVWLDRGRCDRSGSSSCSGPDVESFFAAKSNPNSTPRLSQTFPYAPPRTFYSSSRPRGVLKVDYACSPCVSPSTHVFWKKLGAWNMKDGSARSISQSSLGVTSSAIVDMSAVVHSDPMPGNGKIIVDDLEHSGTKPAGTTDDNPGFLGRGGFLWFGYGCRNQKPNGCADAHSYAEKTYRLFTGPSIDGAGMSPPSSYRASGFQIDNTFQTVLYEENTATSNRGWLRVEYTGTKSSVKVPYAFKSKAAPLGAWSMMDKAGHRIGFTQFGIAANRIGRIATTIRSNQGSIGNGVTQYMFTNLFRPKSGSGGTHDDADLKGGGVSLVDEGRGIFAFKHGAYSLSDQPSYYYNANYAGAPNRGHVLVDYIAGSCEQGLNGFKIQAIPGTQVGDCTGTISPFTVEGGGQDIFNSADDFAFANKSATGDRDLHIRIESQGTSSGWAKAGIMFRANLNADSKHASILMTPSNGAHLTWRPDNSSSTSRTTNNTLKAPYHLRIRKVGKTFTAYYRANSTTSWVQVGSPQTINAFGTTFYYGLAQSSNSPAMNKAAFSGMSGF